MAVLIIYLIGILFCITIFCLKLIYMCKVRNMHFENELEVDNIYYTFDVIQILIFILLSFMPVMHFIFGCLLLANFDNQKFLSEISSIFVKQGK